MMMMMIMNTETISVVVSTSFYTGHLPFYSWKLTGRNDCVCPGCFAIPADKLAVFPLCYVIMPRP